MAEWHLAELDDELRRAGWAIEDVRPGDGYRTSAAWFVARGDLRERLLFEGQTDTGIALPVDRAYACRLEGTDISLYFGRKTKPAWRTDLTRFVAALSARRNGEAGA